MIGNDRLPAPYTPLNSNIACSDDLSTDLIAQMSPHVGSSAEGSECCVLVSNEAVPDKLSTRQQSDRQGSEQLYVVCKRIIDIVGSTVALLLLLPVFVVVATAIILENRGPIFFVQMRVGKDNMCFRFYKFRSMVKNAADLQTKLTASNEATGPIFKMRKDPRVTRVGRILRKYSIDELPQLFNVLRGDMSFVGPRPHLPSEVALYTSEQRIRLSVQPGLVCMREVTGRSELTFDRWIETDLQYIACRSLRTDLSILLRLVPAVIGARGAY